jgi:hypothetical protein
MDIELISEANRVEQGTDEWFALRLGKLTGSRFPAIMPSSRQKEGAFNDTQLKILKELAVERLTGIKTEFFTNKYMEWGTETEPAAREYYELENFCIVKEVGFYPFGDFGDSPDGIIEGVKAVEFKCPKSTTHLDYMLEPKKLLNTYKWQCYGHMIATGLKECDLISFDPRFPEGKKMVIVNIKFEQEEADKLMARLELAESKIKEFCNA